MAIICESYYTNLNDYNTILIKHRLRIYDILEKFDSGIYNFDYSDFGFRRRLSYEAQVDSLKILMRNKHFKGTSNVYLAKELGLRPVGTMAHEYFMMGQYIFKDNIKKINEKMLKLWLNEYSDNVLLTCLTDTLTTDSFIKYTDKEILNKFNGFRHDSGDPYEWFNKIYNSGIQNPENKIYLFSDSLSFDKANEIYNKLIKLVQPSKEINKANSKDKGNIIFGIGGSICSPRMHDFVDMNIVIKPIEVNGQPVVKLSDCEGKNMCLNADYINKMKEEVK